MPKRRYTLSRRDRLLLQAVLGFIMVALGIHHYLRGEFMYVAIDLTALVFIIRNALPRS